MDCKSLHFNKVQGYVKISILISKNILRFNGVEYPHTKITKKTRNSNELFWSNQSNRKLNRI